MRHGANAERLDQVAQRSVGERFPARGGARPHVLDDGLLLVEGLPVDVARRVLRPVDHRDRRRQMEGAHKTGEYGVTTINATFYERHWTGRAFKNLTATRRRAGVVVVTFAPPRRQRRGERCHLFRRRVGVEARPLRGGRVRTVPPL